MLIFVYGDDTFRIREKVRAVRDRFREKFDPTGLNEAEFPSGSQSAPLPAEVLPSVMSAPFLGAKRLVIVRDLMAKIKKDAAEDWARLKETPDSTIVVFWENAEAKAVESSALFKLLKDAADVHTYPFPELSGSPLEKWVMARMKDMGMSAERGVVPSLVARVGSDLWQMQNELEKLRAYADDAPVALAMVDTLVRASFESQIFALMDAVSQGNAPKALQLLDEERASGANDAYIFSMIVRQARILLSARLMLEEQPGVTDRDIAKELHLHPFVAQKALSQARAFSSEDLLKFHSFLLDLDAGSKNGRHDGELAVDLAVADLLV